jgi:predicted exporter
MGVDYGIFLTDAPPEHPGPALVSITLSCLSTVLSFGALALSKAPALSALGSTIALGVLLSLILAPTSLLLTHRAAPHEPDSSR